MSKKLNFLFVNPIEQVKAEITEIKEVWNINNELGKENNHWGDYLVWLVEMNTVPYLIPLLRHFTRIGQEGTQNLRGSKQY